MLVLWGSDLLQRTDDRPLLGLACDTLQGVTLRGVHGRDSSLNSVHGRSTIGGSLVVLSDREPERNGAGLDEPGRRNVPTD